MTTTPANRPQLRTDVRFVDEPPFFARIAWRQVLVLGAIGLAVLGPLGLAIMLAV